MNKVDRAIKQIQNAIKVLEKQLDHKLTQEDRRFVITIGKKQFISRIPMDKFELRKLSRSRSDIIKRIIKKSLSDYINQDKEAFDLIGSFGITPSKKHYQFSASSKEELIAPELDKDGKKITSKPFDKSAYVEGQNMWSSAEIYNREEDNCPELKALNDEIRKTFGVV